MKKVANLPQGRIIRIDNELSEFSGVLPGIFLLVTSFLFHAKMQIKQGCQLFMLIIRLTIITY